VSSCFVVAGFNSKMKHAHSPPLHQKDVLPFLLAALTTAEEKLAALITCLLGPGRTGHSGTHTLAAG
jgi:hypothetical protein